MEIVLRIGRRRTAWEGRDVEEILQTEFWDKKLGTADLRPSVYVLRDVKLPAVSSEVVRTHAEHAASFLSSPPNGATDVDLQGLPPRPPVNDDDAGEAKFLHARDAHHELEFRTEMELRETISRLLEDPSEREFEVSRADLLDHAIERLNSDDPEWLHACSKPPGSGWRKLIAKRRGERRARTDH